MEIYTKISKHTAHINKRRCHLQIIQRCAFSVSVTLKTFMGRYRNEHINELQWAMMLACCRERENWCEEPVMILSNMSSSWKQLGSGLLIIKYLLFLENFTKMHFLCKYQFYLYCLLPKKASVLRDICSMFVVLEFMCE